MSDHFNRCAKGLLKTPKAQLRQAWDEWCKARDDFAINITRSRYRRMQEAGENVIKLQDALGVWLIHPANAVPGLSQYDERIVEDETT